MRWYLIQTIRQERGVPADIQLIYYRVSTEQGRTHVFAAAACFFCSFNAAIL